MGTELRGRAGRRLDVLTDDSPRSTHSRRRARDGVDSNKRRGRRLARCAVRYRHGGRGTRTRARTPRLGGSGIGTARHGPRRGSPPPRRLLSRPSCSRPWLCQQWPTPSRSPPRRHQRGRSRLAHLRASYGCSGSGRWSPWSAVTPRVRRSSAAVSRRRCRDRRADPRVPGAGPAHAGGVPGRARDGGHRWLTTGPEAIAVNASYPKLLTLVGLCVV
jgi:hypothetical protein